MHKKKRKCLSAGGMGQQKERKYFSAGGMGQWEIFLLATTRGSRNFVVSEYILRSGHPALTFSERCVQWPTFDPLFFWGRGERPNSEIRTIALP